MSGQPHLRKRPSAAGQHRGSISKASFYEGRYEAEILHAGVFLDACSASSTLTECVPLEFPSVDQYVATFDPLVLEEAREGIRSGMMESESAGQVAAGIVSKIEEVGTRDRATKLGGPSVSTSSTSSTSSRFRPPTRPHVRVCITAGGGNNSDLARLDLKNSVAVFSFVPMSAGAGNDKNRVFVPGMCVSSSVQSGLVLKVYNTCTAHRNAENPPCAAWLSMLRANPAGTSVRVTKATQLTSSEREFDALHMVSGIDSALMRYILKPSMLVSMKEVYETNKRRELWPREAANEPFVKFLKKQYDRKQLEAIEMTACQLSVTSSAASAASSLSSSLSTKLPFVLIQGPPGTGKTHTVCGILNVWHLAAYQQYYNSLIRSVKALSASTGSGLDSVAAALRPGFTGLGSVSRKPRILVCTPSNAACDELMARVMKFGFCDGRGNTYHPNIVRIGGDAVVDGRVKDRFLGTLVKSYTSMTKQEWHHMHQAKQTLLVHQRQQVRQLEMSLAKAARSDVEMNQMAQVLLSILQEMERVERQVDKLTAAWPSIMAATSTSTNASGKNSEERQSEEELKTLLLSEAEMVFSTLSSTQQKIFKDSSKRAPFHTVLIDEAGQASEVAALQPLTAGAKSIVLVGDPQQLPATIKSDAAKAVEMERSLFERLQLMGCPVALLSVQYRMHPEIRRFPSKHFYRDKLEDAQSVIRLPPEPYHAIPCLGPYQVFDVASGREERGKSSSLSNPEEARLAACLYMKLFKNVRASGHPDGAGQTFQSGETERNVGVPSVAVITPYRQQKSVLRQTFLDLCGEGVLDNISVETIDSYQGRQVDVVILSCVRAGASGGLGFVTDVRRMNVAITRARRSLWILGALGTLKKNKEWAALIDDAKERHVIVGPAQARELLRDELADVDAIERRLLEERDASKTKLPSTCRSKSNEKSAKKKVDVIVADPKPMKKAKKPARGDAVPDRRTADRRQPNSVRPMKKEHSDAANATRPQSQKPMAKNRSAPSRLATKAAAASAASAATGARLGVVMSDRIATVEKSLVNTSNSQVNISEGKRNLERLMELFGSGGRDVDKDVGNYRQEGDAAHPFDPAKPRATKGRAAMKRRRKAAAEAVAGGDKALEDDAFTVSKRFPQLPEGR